MKLCIMNQREGNSSKCDEVPSTKLHKKFNSDSDDSSCSPNSDSDCDFDIEMTNASSTSSLSSPSPPASPASLASPTPSPASCHGDDNLTMNSNRPASPVIADYTTCSHCANSALTSASSSSSSSPLSDLTNKRLCTAKEIVSVIRKGKFDEFLNLLHSKPNLDLNTFVNGNTALHYCLLFGRDISWCKQLVSKGANPNLSNIDGWHPIHLAAYGQHHDILAYLVRCNSRQIV